MFPEDGRLRVCGVREDGVTPLHRGRAAEEPKVCRLPPGENWIRNFSSALPLVVSRVSEIRDPRRGAGRIGVRFASPQEGADSNSG